MPAASSRPPVRERLLDAADALFYSESVQTVGVDRVIETAGVAKASLYRAFGSKEALVGAYLERHHHAVVAALRGAAAEAGGGRPGVVAVFGAQSGFFTRPDFRGCPFAAASVGAAPGSAARVATQRYRDDVRALLVGLCSEAGAPDAEQLARQLHLVYDGANLAAHLDQAPDVAAVTLVAVEALLVAALPDHHRP